MVERLIVNQNVAGSSPVPTAWDESKGPIMNEEYIRDLVVRLRQNFLDKMPVWTIQGEAADVIEKLLIEKANGFDLSPTPTEAGSTPRSLK